MNNNINNPELIDDGNLCGIKIVGSDGDAYILTSTESTKFIIKTKLRAT